ncbi:MAG TPA: hypothetical protein VIH76_07370 [Candidatus Acidoferrales bacterium]
MKVIKARIKGVGLGILLHNPAGMGQSNGKKVIPTPEQEAAAGCYWTEDETSVAIPSWNLSRALVRAAALYKDGKVAMSRIVAGSVAVEPAMLSFGTNEYAIDTRRAVVQRQGILRSRPLLTNWLLDFDLLVSEEDVSPKAFPMLRAICEDAGRRVGIGDFRIEKNGPFGKFVVESWEVQ